MIFASSTPHNMDRNEWCMSEECRHRYWRSGSMPTHRAGSDCPEFDQPRVHDVNPVLLQFRNDVELNHTIPGQHLALVWVDRDEFAFEAPTGTLSQAAHARRVLTRLATFGEIS